MPIINGTDWTRDDFTPFSYYENWDPFWTDVMAEAANVEADRIAAQAARNGAETARDAAAGSAGAAAADRVQTGADRAAMGTALATAQALVGSAGTGTATGLAFAALTKSLATATDVVAVHLYDTRLDSDGGAWTDRPAGSWYWETLGTATRGATRRFPKVALIVARASTLTIYDPHDLDGTGVPRMWMDMPNSGTGANITGYAGSPASTNVNAVTARNGRIYLAIAGATGGGVVSINFLADRARRHREVGASLYQGTISERTATKSWGAEVVSEAIVARVAHHVHAQIIPGGPLDSAGLPIPTVAVATAGGVSVIHPNGAVYDITGAAFRGVSLTASGRLLVMYDASAQVDVGVVPYADVARTSWRQYAYSPANMPVLAPGTATGQSLSAQAIGYSDRLSLLAEDAGNPANGMVAYVTKDYATGWQPGDIRGAYLCDTTTGNITGSAELVANGDFASGTTGWSPVNASLSTSAGQLVVTRSGSGNAVADASITVTPGQTYCVRVEAAKATTTGSLNLHITDGSTGGALLLNLSSSAASTVFLGQFTPVSSTAFVRLFHGGTVAGETALFDNISVRLALPDRSYRGRGLAVNGTLARTALPCGLAAVSGFSGSNFLEQQYNPDLDFGTGDWSYRLWVNGLSASATIFERAAYAGAYSGPGIRLIADGSGAAFLSVSDDGWASADTVSGATVSGWTQIIACRRGGFYELWQNGVRVGVTAVNNANATLSNASAVWRVGLRLSGAGAFLHSVALAGIAAYAPTPAQIRRMWEDESALMISGLPATLGGTSNSVTALAANEGNGTLAVGTGDGVSIFAGLGRVQYLDGASGAAAIANDAITSVSASGPHLLIGTSAGAGIISDSVIARDRLAPAGPPVPRAASDPEVIRARVVTTDATPTDMVPRLIIGEREAVTVDVTVQARTYGATSTQGGTYRRMARYIRDASGNVTLAGSVQTIGTDQETTAGMDVTIQADTAAQTITPRVTGVAGTRMVWTARIVVTRISEEASYAA